MAGHIRYAIHTHEAFVASVPPNYLGSRIPVRPKLNINHFQDALVDHQDKDILDFMEFGFPTVALGLVPDNPSSWNHAGAERYANIYQIDAYIKMSLR